MGSPPLPDLPPPTADAPPGANVSAGFAPGPAAADLCGFKVPSLRFKFGFKVFGIDFPPKVPLPYFGLGIRCDLANPIDISGGLKYGGGRSSNNGPDPDKDDDAP